MLQTSMRKEDGVNESAETLRIALPLMTRYKVPTTPENYSIWFHYVIGDRPGLNDFIDNLLEQKTPFTQDVNEHIYQQFLSDQHLQQAEQVSKTLVSALAETTAALRHTGSEADHYHSVLSSFDKSCGSAQSLTDVFELLNTVLKETQSMQQSMKRLQQDFLVKSDDMDKLRKELDQVRKQASTDALTGLYNRTTFFDSLEAVDAESNPLSNPYSVAMIDIDHFKRVNDTFGHLYGDEVLIHFARLMERSFRYTDDLFRFGGEEFVVLLSTPEAAQTGGVLERFRQRVEAYEFPGVGRVTVSIGFVTSQTGILPTTLIDCADRALYVAKESGRNRVVNYADISVQAAAENGVVDLF